MPSLTPSRHHVLVELLRQKGTSSHPPSKHCHRSGGAAKIIAAIEDPAVITRILAHFGLPTRAPPRHLRYAIPASLAVRPARSGTGVHAS